MWVIPMPLSHDVVRALNGRAMAWCIANDLTEAAVVYAHAVGEIVLSPIRIRALRRGNPWYSIERMGS